MSIQIHSHQVMIIITRQPTTSETNWQSIPSCRPREQAIVIGPHCFASQAKRSSIYHHKTGHKYVSVVFGHVGQLAWKTHRVQFQGTPTNETRFCQERTKFEIQSKQTVRDESETIIGSIQNDD
jgi:hypothetical protein